MDPKLIVIIGFAFLYGFFEMFMNMAGRKKAAVERKGDKGSLILLYVSITIGYFLSFSVGSTKMGRLPHWNMFFAIGMALVLLGLIIRITSIMTLKRHFTYSVKKLEDHQLIETGLYALIRHPGYLGQLIIFTGIPLALSNWFSVLAMLVPVLFGYLYRITVEERFMLEEFGTVYTSYMNRTKRLIPKIY